MRPSGHFREPSASRPATRRFTSNLGDALVKQGQTTRSGAVLSGALRSTRRTPKFQGEIAGAWAHNLQIEIRICAVTAKHGDQL